MPRISIVVISTHGPELLSRCLRALIPQLDDDCELLVCLSGPQPALEDLSEVKIVWCVSTSPASGPGLRALGLARADGEVIAMLEDNCAPQADWLRNARQAAPDSVTGGHIVCEENASLSQRAAYTVEYGRFSAPGSAGPSDWETIPGLNVVYGREILEKHRSQLLSDRWEYSIFPEMHVEGGNFVRNPQMIVTFIRHADFATNAREFYRQGRETAGILWPECSSLKKVLLRLLGPAIPAVLLCRQITALINSGTGIITFFTIQPFLFAFTTSWVLGEWIVYLTSPFKVPKPDHDAAA